MDREATTKAIWTFVGFPASYETLLGESQHPLASDAMLEVAAQAGLSDRSLVLDAACFDASCSLPLVERFGCRLIGVDLNRHAFAAGEASTSGARRACRLSYVQGRLEALPVATASCDLVWCRDAISCADCAMAMSELARVTKAGGTVLLYTSCATPLLEPREREVLFADLGLDAASMDAATIEREAVRAGLAVRQRLMVGSQWLQHRLENDPSPFDLLSLARLTQWPERYVAAWGKTWYRRILGWHQWPIYQALGKLEGRIWVFRAPGAPSRVPSRRRTVSTLL